MSGAGRGYPYLVNPPGGCNTTTEEHGISVAFDGNATDFDRSDARGSSTFSTCSGDKRGLRIGFTFDTPSPSVAGASAASGSGPSSDGPLGPITLNFNIGAADPGRTARKFKRPTARK